MQEIQALADPPERSSAKLIRTGYSLNDPVRKIRSHVVQGKITGSISVFAGRRGSSIALPWRGFSIAFAFFLLILAIRVYIGRFVALFEEHTIFGGVTYTDAHVMLTGLLVVCAALILGAAIVSINVVAAPRVRWLAASIAPAVVCYVALQAIGWLSAIRKLGWLSR